VRGLALAVLLAVAAPARGESDGVGRVALGVGESAELQVGNALGWFCDDPSLVTAEIVHYEGYNTWVVTGANVGLTHCRVGTTVGRASYLFEVEVSAARE
jgi:hypothetical protein